MKLAKLFTVGFVALSMSFAGCANPTQVTEKDSDSEVKSSQDKGGEETKAMSGQAKAGPGEAPAQKPLSTLEVPEIIESELELIFGGHTLIAGSEVSLSPVMQADWIKGEAPESFEPGKVYIFECWSTRCGPCIAMIPHVNELHKKYYDKGLRIYGMSVYESNKQECMDFVKEKGDGMSYPVAFTGPGGPFEVEWMKPAGARGIPHAFIVKDGELLASTLASRLTNELVELMLDGDEGAEKAKTIILADQIHQAKVDGLLANVRSARKAGDAETMTANIEKLKVIEPENPEIHTAELWVLIVKEEWPAAATALNEMSASWAKESFVSMNGMRLARKNSSTYPEVFEKALIHSYSDYAFNEDFNIGLNHFAGLSILQLRIDEKENAITTTDKMLEAARAFSNGNEAAVTPYVRFKKAVHEGTVPTMADLSGWLREERDKAKAAL